LSLRSGDSIPIIGLGVFKSKDKTFDAVTTALKLGYRHIDTAQGYNNEVDVGRAIKESGIPREEIFVTTKLWSSAETHTYDEALKRMKKSLDDLGLEYVDLFLMHSPFKPEGRIDTWRAIEEMKRRKWAKHIGVSNFGKHHVEALLKACSDIPEGAEKPVCTEMPEVNQVELTPFIQRKELVEFCEQHGIMMQAYSPLTRGKRLNDPKQVEMAAKLGVTVPQLMIRWCIQKGFVVLPKSVQPERIKENFEVFNFSIPEDAMQEMDGWDEYYVTGWDPTVDP